MSDSIQLTTQEQLDSGNIVAALHCTLGKTGIILWDTFTNIRICVTMQELANIPQVKSLIEAAQEIGDLVEDIRTGSYKLDSFTLQPLHNALAPFRKESKDV